MSIDFSTIKSITIPEGNVKRIVRDSDGSVIWSSGPTLGSLAVGSSVWLNVDGVSTEFLIVHQGLPDADIYDSSCDGTWLLMKNIYALMAWDSSNNTYSDSDIHAYLNGTFLGLFDTNIKNSIKEVKIPSDSLTTSCFLLGHSEIGSSISMVLTDGAHLSYFKTNDAIAYYNGTASSWYLRSKYLGTNNLVEIVNVTGSNATGSVTATNIGIRPAIILPANTIL